MGTTIDFAVRQAIIELAGACFWYWQSFHDFLASCGVPRNLYSLYPKDAYNKYDVMRAILSELQRRGDSDTISNLVSAFYRLRRAVDSKHPDQVKAKQLLEDFRRLVGSDPIEIELQERERRIRRAEAQRKTEEHQDYEVRLSRIYETLVHLSNESSLTPQARGFELERLFYELLRVNEFEFSPSYRTNGEQIDGHFRFQGFDYLLEAKWTTDPADQADLSVFDVKIRGKAQSTRGLFLSMTNFNPNAIKKFSGDSPRIVLMDGSDLMLILGGNISLFDALKSKVDALVRYGQILTSIVD